ncbi:MAG: 30S ribosomal protein S8 [Candidatus Pacearchaeota archaeon]|nr:30S ribosomal protein S8 [Candidatus Pacearchaeota archaeon]
MVVRDWLSSMLNDLVNCKKAGKKETAAVPVSKLMLDVLKIMKENGYIQDYRVEEEKFKKVIIKIGKLNKCKAIKPRFFVQKDEFEKYIKRFLPARNLGILIVSTNKGLMTHKEAIEKGIGGSLIAYCY